MTGWLPATLKARAIGIFVAVLTLSQLGALALFEHNRKRTIVRTEAADLADRIIGIANLARNYPAEDREQILKAAENRLLSLYPDLASIDEVACQHNELARRMTDRFAPAFDGVPGFNARVCVRSLDRQPILADFGGIGGFDVLVFIDFPNREQTVFHSILPESNSLLAENIVIYMLFVGTVALLPGWLMIRRATAPLERLARAADDFGTNIDNPPLAERGPREEALAARAFNRMQQRLSQLIHGQTEMLAAISHDLRSTVTRLQLRIELLRESEEKEGLIRAVGDMRQMVQSVLDFARGRNSRELLRRVNLSALVESLCDDLAAEGFPVTCHCGQPAIHLRGRVTDIRRGVHNLIDNAIRYGGSATVTLDRTPETAVIRVEDNGPGIPEAEFDAVLRPFYRLGSSRNDATGGVGLGLSITLDIIRSLGGDIRLSNRPGGGLRAEMQLPLTTPNR